MNFETGSVSRTFSLLHEHQDGDPDHRLGHRHDPEDGVPLHRLLRLDVHQAVALEMSDAPVAGDERHRPGKGLRGNLPLHQIAYPRQALRRQADILGSRRRRGGGQRPQRG
jgi:hypothetical protein